MIGFVNEWSLDVGLGTFGVLQIVVFLNRRNLQNWSDWFLRRKNQKIVSRDSHICASLEQMSIFSTEESFSTFPAGWSMTHGQNIGGQNQKTGASVLTMTCLSP
jgi:hypothetical protein